VIAAVNQQSVDKVSTIQRLVEQVGVKGELEVTVKRSDRTIALKISPEQLPRVETP